MNLVSSTGKNVAKTNASRILRRHEFAADYEYNHSGYKAITFLQDFRFINAVDDVANESR